MTFEEAVKKAIKAYWESEEGIELSSAPNHKYNKKYLKDLGKEHGLQDETEELDKKGIGNAKK